MIFDPPSPHILLPAIRLKGKRKPLALAAHAEQQDSCICPHGLSSVFFFFLFLWYAFYQFLLIYSHYKDG